LDNGGDLILLDGHSHVTTVSTLSAVALILTNALVCRQASITTASTRPLAITPLLALSAALAAGLGGKIRLVILARGKWNLSGRCNGLLSRRGHRSWRHWATWDRGQLLALDAIRGTGSLGGLGRWCFRNRGRCLRFSRGFLSLARLALASREQRLVSAILIVSIVSTNFGAFRGWHEV
jgi:hypothetical protein